MRLAIAIAIVAAAAGCQDRCSEIACTADVESVMVTVTDADGTPVSGLIPVSSYQNGPAFFVDQELAAFVPGLYVVIDDGQRDIVNDDIIVFHASSATASATASFEVTASDCRCHIQKVSGPDTLILQ